LPQNRCQTKIGKKGTGIRHWKKDTGKKALERRYRTGKKALGKKALGHIKLILAHPGELHVKRTTVWLYYNNRTWNLQ
jgi:hypothetical protein